ncbi:MAG: energy transducer TonB [Terriglobales bacterium]
MRVHIAFCSLAVITLLGLLALAPTHVRAANELEQRLRDGYQGKTLLLRGFYTGDKLQFDATGAPVGGPTPGDWTTDGVVRLTQINASGNRLTIKARRLLVSSSQGTLRFLAEDPKKEKKSPLLKIEADLDSSNPSPEQAAAAMSRIFLTAQDDFADQVPDYWKPCVRSALRGKDAHCSFSVEFLSIPGATSSVGNALPSAATGTVAPASNDTPFKVGHGVSPPRAILPQHEPAFSEPARKAKYQGVVTLGLVVNQEGLPTKIHIVNPLGCGLDAKAVEAVETWRFDPAKKDGQPVAASIMVEVDFHLY